MGSFLAIGVGTMEMFGTLAGDGRSFWMIAVSLQCFRILFREAEAHHRFEELICHSCRYKTKTKKITKCERDDVDFEYFLDTDAADWRFVPGKHANRNLITKRKKKNENIIN